MPTRAKTAAVQTPTRRQLPVSDRGRMLRRSWLPPGRTRDAAAIYHNPQAGVRAREQGAHPAISGPRRSVARMLPVRTLAPAGLQLSPAVLFVERPFGADELVRTLHQGFTVGRLLAPDRLAVVPCPRLFAARRLINSALLRGRVSALVFGQGLPALRVRALALLGLGGYACTERNPNRSRGVNPISGSSRNNRDARRRAAPVTTSRGGHCSRTVQRLGSNGVHSTDPPLYPMRTTIRKLAERWPHPFEHESGDDKWNAAGLNAVQRCPRRRAGVACDERTTDAVGISC